MMGARCLWCNARIIWAETVGDRVRMPLDEKPVPDGRFKLDETYTPPRTEYAEAGDPPGDRFRSHLTTCKQKGDK
jgi:hypothetical protein